MGGIPVAIQVSSKNMSDVVEWGNEELMIGLRQVNATTNGTTGTQLRISGGNGKCASGELNFSSSELLNLVTLIFRGDSSVERVHGWNWRTGLGDGGRSSFRTLFAGRCIADLDDRSFTVRLCWLVFTLL